MERSSSPTFGSPHRGPTRRSSLHRWPKALGDFFSCVRSHIERIPSPNICAGRVRFDLRQWNSESCVSSYRRCERLWRRIQRECDVNEDSIGRKRSRATPTKRESWSGMRIRVTSRHHYGIAHNRDLFIHQLRTGPARQPCDPNDSDGCHGAAV